MPKVILVAGMATKIAIDTTGYDVIGVDHGAVIAMRQEIAMIAAIGDFDSISEEQHQALAKVCTMIELPAHKNESDSEVAIQYALEQGYDEIVLYGGMGGRKDHELANMYLLMHRNYPLILMDEQNRMRKLDVGVYQIPKSSYTYISFLPLAQSCITETGVAYPLRQREMDICDIYGISNEIVEAFATIEIHKGSFLMIEANDPL